MKNLTIGFIFIGLIFSCTSKLKIYDIHKVRKAGELKKNFYLKDESISFERLKGTWMWANKKDTLIMKVVPKYKLKYDEKIFSYENAYRDTGLLYIKYVKDGDTIYDNLDETQNSCFFANTFKIQTNIFYLHSTCKKDAGSYLTFMNGNNSLSLLSPFSGEEKVLLKKEGEYEIKVPNSIILDRVIE